MPLAILHQKLYSDDMKIIRNSAEKTRNCNRIKRIRLSAKLSALVLSLVLLLTGCLPNNFTREEKAAFLKTAREVVSDFLKEQYRGAKIKNIQPETDVAADGSGYELTEFASGQFSMKGQTYDFLVNTESGQVYTSVYLEEITETLKETLLQDLGIDASEAAIVSYDFIYLPIKEISGYIDMTFRNVFPQKDSAEELLQEILQDTGEYRVAISIQYKGEELPREITEKDSPFPALTLAKFYRVAKEYELYRQQYSTLYLPNISGEILQIYYSQGRPEDYSYVKNQVMEQGEFHVVYNTYERTREEGIVTESTITEEDITLTVTEEYISLDCKKDNYAMYLFTTDKNNAKKYLYTFDQDANYRAVMKECRWYAYGDKYFYAGTFTNTPYEFNARYPEESIIYTKSASEDPPIFPQSTKYEYIY